MLSRLKIVNEKYDLIDENDEEYFVPLYASGGTIAAIDVAEELGLVCVRPSQKGRFEDERKIVAVYDDGRVLSWFAKPE